MSSPIRPIDNEDELFARFQVQTLPNEDELFARFSATPKKTSGQALAEYMDRTPPLGASKWEQFKSVASNFTVGRIITGMLARNLGGSRPGSIHRATADLGLNTMGNIAGTMQDPAGVIGGGLQAAKQGVTQAVTNVAQSETPIRDAAAGTFNLAKSIIIDGIVEPFVWNPIVLTADAIPGIDLLEPEEREQKIQDSVINITAMFMGWKLMDAVRTAAYPKAITNIIKESKSFDDAVARLHTIPENDLLNLAAAQIPNDARAKVLRGMGALGAGGAPVGFVYGDDPETAWKNAIQFGAASAAIGGVAAKLMRGKAPKASAEIENMQRTAQEILQTRYKNGLAGFGYENWLDDPLKVAEKIFKPKELIEIAENAIPDGHVGIVQGVPIKDARIGSKQAGRYVHVRADGTTTLLITGKSGKGTIREVTDGVASYADPIPFDLTNRQARQFTTYGFYEGQTVDFGGKHFVISGDSRSPFNGKRVTLANELGTVLHKDVPVSDLKYVGVSQAAHLSPVRSIAKEFDDIGLSNHEILKLHQFFADELKLRQAAVNDISVIAANTGHRLVYEGGRIQLSRIGEKEPFRTFDTPMQVHEYLDNVISHPSGELVGGLSNAALGVALGDAKLEYTKHGRLEAKLDALNLSTPLGRRTSDIYDLVRSIETFTKIPILKGFLDLQGAARRHAFKINQDYTELNPIFKALSRSKRVNSDDTIQFLETASADELMGSNPLTRAYRGRNMSRLEIEDAKRWAQVEGFDDALKVVYDIGETVKKSGNPSPEGMVKLIQAKAKDAELNPDQINVVTDIISRLDKYQGRMGEYSTYGPIRAAQAIRNKEITKEQWLAKRGLKNSPEELAILQLGDWLERKADQFGIPIEQRVNHYFPRRYINDAPDIPQRIATMFEDPNFAHAMHRSGVRQDYIRDLPFVVQGYLHSGHRKGEFLQKIKEFQELADQVGGMEIEAKAGKRIAGKEFSRLLETHIRELQHFTSPEALANEFITQRLADLYGIEMPAFKNFADRITGTVSFTAMSFNPMFGLRDLASVLQFANMRLGVGTVGRAIKLDNSIADKAARDAFELELKEKGITPGKLKRLSYKDVDTPIEGWKSWLKETRTKIGEFGFRLSLQEQVYERTHRIFATERLKTVGDEIYKFAQHKKQARLEEAIELNRYSTNVQNNFRQLINEGKFSEATDFLADATGFEIVGLYGLANHPVGWGTGWGRALGQFGKWPMWAIRQLGNIAATGDKKTLARWAIMNGTLVGAGAATGINFQSWVMAPTNMMYMGGPLADVALKTVQAVQDQGMTGEAARRALFNMLPVDLEADGEYDIKSLKQIYMPIPFQFWNVMEATGLVRSSDMMERVYWENPHLLGAKMLGFSTGPMFFGIDPLFGSTDIPINAAARERAIDKPSPLLRALQGY